MAHRKSRIMDDFLLKPLEGVECILTPVSSGFCFRF